MLSLVKRKIRAAALCRWAAHAYSPNGAPAPLYRILKGRRRLTYIDVGAHNGDFFQELIDIGDFACAVLIEPLPHLAEKLRRRFPRQIVVEAVIGKDERVVEFNNYPDAPYMSSPLRLHSDKEGYFLTEKGNRRVIPIQQRTLDNIADDSNIDHVDLIKIDTQGSEVEVIAGASNLLKTTAAIWIEVSFIPLYEGSCLFHEVHRLLYGAGFRLTELAPAWRSPSGELAQADALFLRM